MEQALYRKYRPQIFEDVVGQNPIKTTLKNEIETGKVAHAFLLCGPRGCGKTTTARLIAKAVNCLNRKDGKSEPCNTCGSCIEINQSNSFDLIEIDAASHTGVDNVRDNIIENSRFTPVKRKHKVFIIDEAHMLTTPAFNALLKTLEEPPEYVIFILATTEIHKLPQTIISRCQRFDFKKVGAQDLILRLSDIVSKEKRNVDKEVLGLISVHSDGSVRDAETLLSQVLSIGSKKITLDEAKIILPYSDLHLALNFVSAIVENNSQKAIEQLNKYVDEGVDLVPFSKDVINIFRNILLFKVGPSLLEGTLFLSRENQKTLQKMAKDISVKNCVRALSILMERTKEIKTSPIIQLPLEIAVLQIIGDEKKDSSDDKEISENFKAEKKETTVKKESLKTPALKELKIEKASIIQKQTTKHFSLDNVKEKWDDVLTRIKEYNTTLFSFLRPNKPIALRENVVQIGVAFDFHRERIIEQNNKTALEEILSEILGTKVLIECVKIENTFDLEDMVEAKSEEDKKKNDSLEDMASAFGGEVI